MEQQEFHVDINDLRKLLHDLRGPIVNLAGFHAEVEDALRTLHDVIESERHNLSQAAYLNIKQTLDDDVNACMGYAVKSSETLTRRLDEFSAIATK